MTSKLVVNTIEADTGISSVSFASSISMSSTSKFHFSAAGVDIGADTNISRLGNGILGFKINGAEKFRIDSSGHIKAVGVCTATHFYGDGSNLTGITQTTINNRADNRVLTATGSDNVLNAESNVHIDGSGRLMVGTTTEGYSSGDNLTVADSSNAGITIRSGTSNGGNIYFSDGTSGADEYRGVVSYDHASNFMRFYTNATEKLRINSIGGVGINTNNFSGQLNNEVGLAIHGSSNDNCRISITTPTKSDSRLGYYGLNRFGIDVHSGFEIRDASSSYATRLLIASNGDIGINDTSPTAHSSGNNTVLSIKGKGSSYSGKIDFKDSDGNLDSYINSDNSILQFYADPNSQNGNTLMRFYVHGAERFRFGAAGQFGIGTNYGTAGQVLKSGGAIAAPTWGSAGGHTETYARVVFGAVYDTNSGYIVHNITTGSSNGITIDTTNERVTPTVAGTYLVIYNAHWMGLHSSGATYYNRITKNGSEYISSNFSAYDPGSHMHTVMTTIDMNGSSDYIQFEFYENKSGAAAYVNHKSRAVVILLDT